MLTFRNMSISLLFPDFAKIASEQRMALSKRVVEKINAFSFGYTAYFLAILPLICGECCSIGCDNQQCECPAISFIIIILLYTSSNTIKQSSNHFFTNCTFIHTTHRWWHGQGISSKQPSLIREVTQGTTQWNCLAIMNLPDECERGREISSTHISPAVGMPCKQVALICLLA